MASTLEKRKQKLERQRARGAEGTLRKYSLGQVEIEIGERRQRWFAKCPAEG